MFLTERPPPRPSRTLAPRDIDPITGHACGLAAGFVERIHDRGGAQPVAQWLFCPMLDDRTAANRELDAVRHILWNNRSNRIGWSAYLGTVGAPGAPDHAVPARRADLTGLPPAWIVAGDAELFHDEDLAYAERLTAAGVPTTFDLVPGAPPAFESLGADTEVAAADLGRAHRWLGDRLGGPVQGSIESTYPPSTRTAAPVVAEARGELR